MHKWKNIKGNKEEKPTVEQKRNDTYDSMTEGKNTYDIMREGKSQHIGDRVKVTDNR